MKKDIGDKRSTESLKAFGGRICANVSQLEFILGFSENEKNIAPPLALLKTLTYNTPITVELGFAVEFIF
jgi:hypothetical protein